MTTWQMVLFAAVIVASSWSLLTALAMLRGAEGPEPQWRGLVIRGATAMGVWQLTMAAAVTVLGSPAVMLGSWLLGAGALAYARWLRSWPADKPLPWA